MAFLLSDKNHFGSLRQRSSKEEVRKEEESFGKYLKHFSLETAKNFNRTFTTFNKAHDLL